MLVHMSGTKSIFLNLQKHEGGPSVESKKERLHVLGLVNTQFHSGK